MDVDEKTREMLRTAADAIKVYNDSYREIFSYLRTVIEPIKAKLNGAPDAAVADPHDVELVRVVSDIISIVEKHSDKVTEMFRE